MDFVSNSTFEYAKVMKSNVIFFIFLMTASGCLATFPLHYVSFGLQRPPQHQFSYNIPQRSFPNQQFFPNYEPTRYLHPLTFSQPQHYVPPNSYVQPQPYGPQQTFPAPFAQPQSFFNNFYNPPPSFPRDLSHSAFSDPYEQTLQYIYKQLPIQTFPTYPRKTLPLERPVLRNTVDCVHMKNEHPPQEIMNNLGLPQTNQRDIERKTTDTEVAMPSKVFTLQGIISNRFAVQSENSESMTPPVESPTTQEATLEEVPVKSTVLDSENPSITPETSTTSESETQSMKSSTTLAANSEETTTRSAILESDSVSTESETAQELVSVAVVEEAGNSEQKTPAEASIAEITEAEKVTLNSTNSESKNTSSETVTPQDVQNIIVESTGNKESDASFAEKMTIESSTVVQSL